MTRKLKINLNLCTSQADASKFDDIFDDHGSPREIVTLPDIQKGFR